MKMSYLLWLRDKKLRSCKTDQVKEVSPARKASDAPTYRGQNDREWEDCILDYRTSQQHGIRDLRAYT